MPEKEKLHFTDEGYGVKYKGEIYYSRDELIEAHHLQDEDVLWIKAGMWGFYDDIEKGNIEVGTTIRNFEEFYHETT